ncbi:MAG: hypothetical protein IH957_04075 [Chloroflexi bacterium]|nr:hypothetical protein [Chloroflexota bacterium]
MAAATKKSAYRYYAAFSEQFVRDVLTAVNLGPDQMVLDPWNGSGTTTRVAAQLGIRAYGVDLNPVMAAVAKARLVDFQEAQDAGQFLAELTHRRPPPARWRNDPLRSWLDEYSASLVRSVADRCAGVAGKPRAAINVMALSPRQAYLIAVLFIAVRQLLAPFVASNPTWVRIPRSDRDRIKIDWKTLRAKLLESALLLQADAFRTPVAQSRVRLSLGSSTFLPPDMPQCSFILTSPPYCTRIDYAVATRPELAVLGISREAQHILRRNLLGATTVPGAVNVEAEDLGITARSLLDEIRHHSAKASSTYYFKWLAQYLVAYARSLKQLSQRADPTASMVLVVQDSHYKDVRIDLAGITKDLLAMHGWNLTDAQSFHLPVTMAGVNPGSRQYRTDFSATEQVLFFGRPAQKGTD